MGFISENSYIHDGTTGEGGVNREWLVENVDGTLAERVAAIGSDKATLHIFGAETISADLDIPDNITVIMQPGSQITISGTTELGINGVCKCLGTDHFVIGEYSWLFFGYYFDSPPVRQFTGDGFGNVKFGCGPQLIATAARLFESSTGWTTIPTGATISGGTLNLSSCTGTIKYTNFTAPAAGISYMVGIHITARTAGTAIPHIGAGTTLSYATTETGHYYKFDVASNSNNWFSIIFASGFSGTIDYVSCRKVLRCGNDFIWANWFGALPNYESDASPAIQKALYAVAVHFTVPLPKIAKLAPGDYYCYSRISLSPYGALHGVEQSVTMYVHPDITEDELITISYGNYPVAGVGGYDRIGERSYQSCLENIKFNCSAVAKDDFAIFRKGIYGRFSGADIVRCRFQGNLSYKQCGIDMDCDGFTTGVGWTTAAIEQCSFKDFKSYSISEAGVVTNDLGAINMDHCGNTQLWQILRCEFNVKGTAIRAAGANYEIFGNNFQASHYPGISITPWGVNIVSSGWSTIAAGANTLTNSVTGATHPWALTGETTTGYYRQAMVKFTDGGGSTGWAAASGLYQIAVSGGYGGTSGAYTWVFEANELGAATAACTGNPATCTVEFCGGWVPRVELYGRGAKVNGNYFDGDGRRVEILSAWNSAYDGAECFVSAIENDGGYAIPPAGSVRNSSITNWVAESTVQSPVYLAATKGADQYHLLVSGNYTASLLKVGNYIWVKQYNATNVFGFVRAIIETSTYTGGNTVVGLTSYTPIVRSDTTIRIVVETDGCRKGTNFFCLYRGQIQAKLPDASFT